MIIGITCVCSVLSLALTIGSIFLFRKLAGNAFGPNQKVLASGLDGTATILSVAQTGVMVNYQPQAVMTLRVEVPGWEPYDVEKKMIIPQMQIPMYQPGAQIPVKVDPENRSKVELNPYKIVGT